MLLTPQAESKSAIASATAILNRASAGFVAGLTVTAIIVPFDPSSILAANRASALIQVNERGGVIDDDQSKSNRAHHM
jgi:hypothetical protein